MKQTRGTWQAKGTAVARWVVCLLFLLSAGASLALQTEQAPTNDVKRAEHYVKKLEARVERMRGQPFQLGYEEKEALKRTAALHEKYPADPAVEDLFLRVRAALMASKGEFMTITQEMVAYRARAEDLVKQMAEFGATRWQALKGQSEAEEGAVSQAFPPLDPTKTDVDEMRGKLVILEDFAYPANEFTNLAQQYAFVGSGSRGYYFVELSDRAWLGAYEALRRYRVALGIEIPQEVKWTLLGRFNGVALLVPQAGKEKTIRAQLGWLVTPVAIFVPGHTLTEVNLEREDGGSFAGEAQLEKLKQANYTVTEIPADVTPEHLVEIFATAIKERNYDLYLDCIDPQRRKTPTAEQLIRYHWELHQHRFAEFYVHVTVGEAEIDTISGSDSDDDVDAFFLTEEQRETTQNISGDLVEMASLVSKAWDERGKQYGSPKPRFLKRINKGRWYITNYKQPF